MRLLVLLLPPLVLALPFAACGGGTNATSDAGDEVDQEEAGGVDASEDITFSVDTGTVTQCKMGDADPVGLCVQKAALESLHAHAFRGTAGATSSWSYLTGAPDKDGGLVAYTADDTVAYAAAAANYLSSATLYGDTTLTATLTADLTAIALLLETPNALAPDGSEYSGEYYAHMRTTAAGLRNIGLSSDGNHVDTLAEAYGRAIYTAHYVSLGLEPPDAGPADAGQRDGAGHNGSADAGRPDGAARDGGSFDAALADARGGDAGGADAHARSDATVGAADAGRLKDASSDARHADAAVSRCPKIDAGAPDADGIIGNPIGGGKVAYAPADVATAAYALLDLASRNPTDCMVPRWLSAVRASLNHLTERAREPSTGMYYRALIAGSKSDGGTTDSLAPSTDPSLPSDALLADTQATFALAMIRAQYTVTSGTVEVDAGQFGADGAIVDAGVTGPFVPILDFPFEARADQVIAAMNGPHSLWDGPVTCPPDGSTGLCSGSAPGAGYMDGYVPSTHSFITTKSTRPNAFMAGALWRGVHTDLNPYGFQLPTLIPLLIAQASASVPPHSNLITVVPSQQAFFQTVSKAFELLDAGSDPASYTTGAVGAAVEGLTEQLFGRSN
jgi:hypothetical protein